MVQQSSHVDSLSTNRRYDLDWLRCITMLVLFFFHLGTVFNTWWWFVKNPELTDKLHYPMLWVAFWRMPLLLFISGSGTYLALGKRTVPGYMAERLKKLFVPLIFGVLVVCPPQTYILQKDQYSSLWDFYATNDYFFLDSMGGSFAWYHMWFIAYLLTYSIVSSPAILFMRSRYYPHFKGKLERVLMNPMRILFIPSGILLISQLVLRPYFPRDTYSLWGDWSFLTLYFLYFLFGLFCYSSQRIWTFIGDQRRFLLAANIIAAVAYGIYRYIRTDYHLPWSEWSERMPYDVLTVFISWFTILTIIGFGQHYLNKPHRWLPVINEAIYPFYILHQTLIVVSAYYVTQLDWSIALKFWTMALLTLISFAVIYFLLIIPFNFMRFLFGLKPRKKASQFAEVHSPHSTL